ncbi:MAG: hypothetical protein HF560_10450 [Synechococcus sp. MIT S9220]|uniref:hypothetical protein n=1 Tax=Synechococcus sp. MIT S9220 TaxID=166309 RepID=UPI0017B73847|nr:hypothetical protein [Synechococcus sp. MIT S9220]
MTRILIRCDASLLIWSDHVMRCRTLPLELQLWKSTSHWPVPMVMSTALSP